jgi:hypothetical protein
MRCLLSVLLVVLCLGCVGCGGSHQSFSVGEVERVFAQHGIPVGESKPATRPLHLYRGEARGIEMTLGGSTLTLRFRPGSEAIRRHALGIRSLQAFCFWPEGTGSNGSSETDVRLSPTRRPQMIPLGAGSSSGGYSCALSAPPDSTPEWPATRFLRQSIVSVHLARTKEVLKPRPQSLFGLPPAEEHTVDRHVRAVLGATNRRTFVTRFVYVFDSAASLQRARRLEPGMLSDRKGSRTANGISTSETACAMHRENVFALAGYQDCQRMRAAFADLR